MLEEERITYFAETDARNKRIAFGIKAKDRTKHMYVLGKTGMGKSTLLENMAIQDIQNGEGLAFIDPHGKTADLLLEYVPRERMNDVVYFAPFDSDFPISFNVMEDVGPDKRHLVVSGLLSAFKKIWVDAWSARMEYILTNIILALLEYPDSTIMGVNRMLSDKDYRKKVVDNVTDVSVKMFWVDEFAKYGDRYMQEAGAAIQNKIGQFVTNPIIRNIIGQPKSSFDIRKLMDEKKILIVNLSKGRVGELNANLLGSMLITKIYLGAMSRADTPERELRKLPNFYLYVDEFQSFANESFADILSEARKYKLNLTIAHQYIEQMSEEVRAAVLGNVGTMIIFRVGAYDADVLEKEFAPTFMKADLVNLGQRQIYLKLMIDDVTSPPFSAGTLPPIKKPESSDIELVLDASRKHYTQPRAIVEEQIRMMHGSQSQTKLPSPERKERTEGRDLVPKHTESATVPAYARGSALQAPREPQLPKASAEPHRISEELPRTEPPKSESMEKPKNNPFQAIKFEQENEGQIKRGKEEGERDVLSLSHLANKQLPKKTNNMKSATPENVNALRDVLSSILKKNEKSKESGEHHEAPRENAKEEAARKSESDIREKHEYSHENKPKHEDLPPPFAPGGRREVPEEVLKKVLSMDREAK